MTKVIFKSLSSYKIILEEIKLLEEKIKKLKNKKKKKDNKKFKLINSSLTEYMNILPDIETLNYNIIDNDYIIENEMNFGLIDKYKVDLPYLNLEYMETPKFDFLKKISNEKKENRRKRMNIIRNKKNKLENK